jgi:hypothetical protein
MIEFNTIHWLPRHLARMQEWQEICKAYDYLLKEAFQALEDLHANMSIYTLTEDGCSMWEKILGIKAKKSDTLEERRYRIQAYWAQELPYTVLKLSEMLRSLCGNDSYKIVGDFPNYKITIKLGIANQKNYGEVEDLLERVLPANLERYIEIMFNTHAALGAYTHEHLATMTHERLRTEVM